MGRGGRLGQKRCNFAGRSGVSDSVSVSASVSDSVSDSASVSARASGSDSVSAGDLVM